MRIGLLGPVELIGDDGQPISLAGERERTLLAALALCPNQVVSTERLIEVLWGDTPPATASNALQAQVSKLRKKLADASTDQPLKTAPQGYSLSIQPGELDLDLFEDVVRGVSPDIRARSKQLAQALAIWRGDALADVPSESLRGEKARLDERRLSVLERRIESDLALGRHGELVGELEALVRRNPLREGLRGQLMIALYRSGRQADALACFNAGRDVLAGELGIDPSVDLQALELAILRQDPSVAAPDAQDLVAPAAGSDHNLPAQVSSFVGRERQLGEVGCLVTEARLVTLTGVGGTGKTRLAIATAAGLVDSFEHGTWFVDLAPLTDPQLVTQTVAAAVGLRDEAGRPAEEALLDGLASRSLLLVVDNCEHLLDACARLVDEVLRRCPRSHVLATSRQSLGIKGEHVYVVPPLQLREDDELEHEWSEAELLFLARAREQTPGLTWDPDSHHAITRLCRRLDGLPLAIELACSRLRSMSVTDIENRLDERFQLLTRGSRTDLGRHKTLQAVIDWSNDLLDDDERVVFERLSVFAGSFDLPVAERVAADKNMEGLRIAELVGALVDKSLIIATPASGGMRFRMLETIREYAGRHLADRPAELEAARAAHARAFLALANEAARHLHSRGQVSWVERLDEEHDNLRAAMDFFRADPATEREALELAVLLTPYWNMRHRREGADTLVALVEPGSEVRPVDDPLRVRAANALALLEWGAVSETEIDETLSSARRLESAGLVAETLLTKAWQHALHSEPTEMDAVTDEAVRLARGIGETHTLAQALHRKAMAAEVNGRLDEARAHFREALCLLQNSGNLRDEAVAWANLANLELATAPDLALEHNLRASALASEVGDQDLLVHLDGNIALTWLMKGDDERAREATLRTLLRADRIGWRFQVAYLLLLAGILAARTDRDQDAALLLGAADNLMASLGFSWEEVEAAPRAQVVEALAEQMDEGLFTALYEQGRDLDYASAIEVATTSLTEQ